VVLTIAHLDHTPENCDPDNLRAWCQRCHLTYDRDHHRQTRRSRKAIGDLFAALPKVLNVKLGHRPGPDCVYIGRFHRQRGLFLPASKWRNPFKVDVDGEPRDGDRDTVIAKFEAWIVQQPELMAALPELRGKDLLCHCAPERCHGDVLLRLANMRS
jgi:hypothetical protein